MSNTANGSLQVRKLTYAAVCLALTVKVYSGSRIEIFGKSDGPPRRASFSWVSGFEITAPPSYSEPVAARVRIETMGRLFPIFLLSRTRSQGSPS